MRIVSSAALTAALGVIALPANAQEAPRSASGAPSATSDAAPGSEGNRLDQITVIGGVRERLAIDTLGSVTVVSQDGIDQLAPSVTSDIFQGMPGVASANLGDDAQTVINLRGLQDNGRVLVLVDGARQDFSRPSHAGYGSFYLDPDILQNVTVYRGLNASGSGLGGVASFETLAPSALLRNDNVAVRQKLMYETNGDGFLTSTTGAVRLGGKAQILGNFVYRTNDEYKDGAGKTILYSDQKPKSGLLKGVFRPALNHEITVAGTMYRNRYWSSRQAGSNSSTLSVDDTDGRNDAVTGRYRYSDTATPLVDFVLNGYWSRTLVDQVKVKGTAATLGQTRYYHVFSRGANFTNTSRFNFGPIENTVLVSGDLARAHATTSDAAAAKGTMETGGGYVQWEADYNDLVQAIGTVRYNHYTLKGLDKTGTAVDRSGHDISPRVTLGVTPIKGFTLYGTYVEGYRPPAIYEMFGIYASASNYQLGLDLVPERAHSWEGGVNFKQDSLFAPGDALRIKANVFDTKIRNYITGRAVSGVYKFYNIAGARLKGLEVEATYDTKWLFVSGSLALIDAEREGPPYDGQPISTAPLDRGSVSAGFRALDRRLTAGVRYLRVGDARRNTASFPTAPDAPAFSQFNLFSSFAVTRNVSVQVNADNVFDKAYTDAEAQYATAAPTSFSGRGRSVKFVLIGRFGG